MEAPLVSSAQVEAAERAEKRIKINSVLSKAAREKMNSQYSRVKAENTCKHLNAAAAFIRRKFV
jgi:hypothetical protein